jgi:hypothetical protein
MQKLHHDDFPRCVIEPPADMHAAELVPGVPLLYAVFHGHMPAACREVCRKQLGGHGVLCGAHVQPG